MEKLVVDAGIITALYGLVGTLITNILIGWGRSLYANHKMYRQLIAEVELLNNDIKLNYDRLIANEKDDASFPLLKRLEMPVHRLKIGDIIINEKISTNASRIISNTNHYNRIIEIGERDANKSLRKTEVLNQGALIFNHAARLHNRNENDRLQPLVGQTDAYKVELLKESNFYKKIVRFFPWYFFFFLFQAKEEASNFES